MTVRDVAFVELYTRNNPVALDYFVSYLGFTRVADAVTSDTSSVLLRQGTVRLILTTGRGVSKFLDQHGEGIADIALACDDVDAAGAVAVAAGARVSGLEEGTPVVAGFGGVSHSLVPVAGAGPALPADRRWVPTPGAPAGPSGPIRLLDHVAVCLEGGTLEDYAGYYRDVFGFSRYSSEYVDVGDQAMDSIVVRGASGRPTFTLVAPDPEKKPGQLDAFLDRNGGPGVQHLAFLVDDIVSTVADCRTRGMEFLSTPDTYYEMLSERLPGIRDEIGKLRAAHILVDRDEWGYLLQLFSRSPYERNTLFYELIQRRGSRGFGSNNIRALYEAVERDRLIAE